MAAIAGNGGIAGNAAGAGIAGNGVGCWRCDRGTSCAATVVVASSSARPLMVRPMLQRLPVSGGGLNTKFNTSGNVGFPPDGGGVGAGAATADLRISARSARWCW